MKIKMPTTTTLTAMSDGPGPMPVANKRFITTWTDGWCLVLTEDNKGEARSGNDNKGKARNRMMMRTKARPVWYYDTKGMARNDDDKG